MNERSYKALSKIVLHCQKAIRYTDDMTEESLKNDSRTLEAVVFNLAQIGELVRLIDDEVLLANPQIPWAAMRGLRNRIIHDYDHVRFAVLWSTVRNDLPTVAADIQKLLP